MAAVARKATGWPSIRASFARGISTSGRARSGEDVSLIGEGILVDGSSIPPPYGLLCSRDRRDDRWSATRVPLEELGRGRHFEDPVVGLEHPELFSHLGQVVLGPVVGDELGDLFDRDVML